MSSLPSDHGGGEDISAETTAPADVSKSPSRLGSVTGFLRQISSQSLLALGSPSLQASVTDTPTSPPERQVRSVSFEADLGQSAEPDAFSPRTVLIQPRSSPGVFLATPSQSRSSPGKYLSPSDQAASPGSQQSTSRSTPSQVIQGLFKRLSFQSLVDAEKQHTLPLLERNVLEASIVSGHGFQNGEDDEERQPRRLPRSNSMIFTEHERRVYSSLYDSTSGRERVWFFIVTVLAIVLRLVSVFSVTTQSSLWIDVIVWPHDQKIELLKQVLQDGYLPEVLQDLASAKAWGSFVITAAGSLFIPIARVLLVVACYCLRIEERHHGKRMWVLFVLDHVGRFILVDIFVMGYMSVFSNNEISLASVFNVPHSDLDVVKDVRLTMKLQLFVTFYAGLISNILGTFMTHHLLLKSIPVPILSDKEQSTKQTILKRFNLSTRGFLWSLEPALLLSAIALAGACFIHLLVFRARIMTLKQSGFTSSLMPSSPAVFDMWTIAHEMPKAIFVERSSDNFFPLIGVYSLAIVFFAVAIALPIILLLTALYMLLVPAQKQFQFDLLFSTPFWFSWCSVDIFLLITLSEYSEVGSMSEYMSRSKYPEMCAFAENTLKMKCTDVEGTFGNGIYSLMILALCLAFVRGRFIAFYEMMGDKETSDRLPVIL